MRQNIPIMQYQSHVYQQARWSHLRYYYIIVEEINRSVRFLSLLIVVFNIIHQNISSFVKYALSSVSIRTTSVAPEDKYSPEAKSSHLYR